MTDIYVRSHSGRQRWIWMGLAVVAAIGMGWAWRSLGTEADEPEPLPDTRPPGPVATPTPTDSSSTAGARENPVDLSELKALIEAGNFSRARQEAFTLLDQTQSALGRREIERLLGDLHIRMVFSRSPMEEKIDHIIRQGDTLGKLANRYGTTADSIKAVNGLDSNVIRIGDRLQILTGDFLCRVNKTTNEMEVLLNDRFFKRYLVGTGTDNSTPEGEYVITLRIRHPVWYRPDGQTIPYGDPENLLGTHYLKLNAPGIGLHGTWEPDSVGSQSSAGCVRLINDEIKELYHLLPEGTTVVITDG
jgi:LysM repeat protein